MTLSKEGIESDKHVEELSKKNNRIKKLTALNKLIQNGGKGYDIACFLEKHFSGISMKPYAFSNCSFMHCEYFCKGLKEEPLKPKKITKWMIWKYEHNAFNRIGAVRSDNQYFLYRGVSNEIHEQIKALKEQIAYLKYKRKNC